MKILIINASHRDGNTDLITKELQRKIVDHEVKEIFLRDIEMKMPDGCVNCAEGEPCPNVQDEFSNKVEPTLRNYDIYLLATPTWSDNVTPLTLIFWNKIVSWCHEDNEYLRGKKLAVITHGMAGEKSWRNVVSWVQSVCSWEQCQFAGSLTCESGSKIGDYHLDDEKLEQFSYKLLT